MQMVSDKTEFMNKAGYNNNKKTDGSQLDNYV